DTSKNSGGPGDRGCGCAILAESGILPSSDRDANRQSSHTDCSQQLSSTAINPIQNPQALQALEDASRPMQSV
ncbi:hypothetical protein ElyMa_000068000, partial [Elysia marginata]